MANIYDYTRGLAGKSVTLGSGSVVFRIAVQHVVDDLLMGSVLQSSVPDAMPTGTQITVVLSHISWLAPG